MSGQRTALACLAPTLRRLRIQPTEALKETSAQARRPSKSSGWARTNRYNGA